MHNRQDAVDHALGYALVPAVPDVLDAVLALVLAARSVTIIVAVVAISIVWDLAVLDVVPVARAVMDAAPGVVPAAAAAKAPVVLAAKDVLAVELLASHPADLAVLDAVPVAVRHAAGDAKRIALRFAHLDADLAVLVVETNVSMGAYLDVRKLVDLDVRISVRILAAKTAICNVGILV